MSYILKALRKSEQERQQVAPETLGMRLKSSENNPETKVRGWIIVLLLVNVLLVIGGAVLFLMTGDQAGKEQLEQIQEVAAQVELLPRKKVSAREKTVVNAPEKKLSTAAPSRSDQLTIANLMQQQKIERKPVPAKQIEVEVQDGDEASAVEESAFEEGVGDQVQSGLETVAQKQESDRLPQEEPAVPWLREMSQEFKRSVPNIQFNVFVYSDNVQESFVMLDWTKYRVGDELPSGLVIKKILRDSAVFEYRQRQFRFSRK